tara:strand:- start:492 stop:623 length:132 start_codon:yes stop_codon:yes gene_type:complete
MTPSITSLLVEIDLLVARLEDRFPKDLILDALEEYLAIADELE